MRLAPLLLALGKVVNWQIHQWEIEVMEERKPQPLERQELQLMEPQVIQVTQQEEIHCMTQQVARQDDHELHVVES